MRNKNHMLTKMIDEASARALSEITDTEAVNAFLSHTESEIARLSTTYHVPADALCSKLAATFVNTLDSYMQEWTYDGPYAASTFVTEALLQASVECAAASVAKAWGEPRREAALLDIMPNAFDLRATLDCEGGKGYAPDENFEALMLLHRGCSVGFSEHEAEALEAAQVLLDSLTWQAVLEG